MNINFGSSAPIKFIIPSGQLAKAQKISDNQAESNKLLPTDLKDTSGKNEGSMLEQLKTHLYSHETGQVSLTHEKPDQSDDSDVFILSTDIPSEKLASETELIKKAASWLDQHFLPKEATSTFTKALNLYDYPPRRLTGETTVIHGFMPPEHNEAEI